jgi:hypothetical protein
VLHVFEKPADLDAFMLTCARLRQRGRHFMDPDGLILELSLWKTDPWNPPFAATPFRGRAGVPPLSPLDSGCRRARRA